jgi:alkanesulfonate monooxygenase SsuD/methylene tetrahydromethanopterin reductase-like flavin-dependent oxidoreductase (luciferase family)
MAAYLHEVSGGRFQFGIGVAHPPSHARMGVTPGKPLADIRGFVAKLRSFEGIGGLPPIILAALRRRMVALAAEIADGVVFANACLSHISHALGVVPAARRDDRNFFIGNRIRTCICDDEAEAKAILRRTVTNYALMPYYRNYWKEAGYVEEMTAIENAVAEGRTEDVPKYLPDRWLADCALYGQPAKIRDGVEAWRAAGVKTPILVPLSAEGDQNTAIRQVFEAFE